MRPSAALDFERLYIFGSGGHGREIAWLAEEAWQEVPEIVFLVDDERYLSAGDHGSRVRMLRDEDMDENSRFVVAVGDPALRRTVAEEFRARQATAATMVHPRVEMSQRVVVREGAVICAGSIVTSNVRIGQHRIGQHSHINLSCTLSHDVTVGAFATLSPGVHVAGNVHIGEGVFVGIGANIINGTADAPLVIGDGAVIAAGACVINSVESGALVAGVPARRKR